MKISIVTICFNCEETIRDTIESVLSQSHTDTEYIIVDGLSTDSTMGIVNQYKNRISSIISEPDEGIYDAMNKGINAASGEIVSILNADDFFEDAHVLKQVVEAFEKHKNADMVFGDVVFSAVENLKKIVRYYSSKNFRRWKLRFGWMPPHPATFIKRKVYLKYGLFKLGYKIAADYEMFVRLLYVKQLNYCRIDSILVRMRIGGVSTSGLRNSILLNREIVKACRANGLYTNLLLVMSKLPFKLLELLPKLRYRNV